MGGTPHSQPLVAVRLPEGRGGKGLADNSLFFTVMSLFSAGVFRGKCGRPQGVGQISGWESRLTAKTGTSGAHQEHRRLAAAGSRMKSGGGGRRSGRGGRACWFAAETGIAAWRTEAGSTCSLPVFIRWNRWAGRPAQAGRRVSSI